MRRLAYPGGGPTKVISAFRTNSPLWYRIATIVTFSLAAAAASPIASHGLTLDELCNRILSAIPGPLTTECPNWRNTIIIRHALQALLNSEKLLIVRTPLYSHSLLPFNHSTDHDKISIAIHRQHHSTGTVDSGSRMWRPTHSAPFHTLDRGSTQECFTNSHPISTFC